jgi:hypothetical protein
VGTLTDLVDAPGIVEVIDELMTGDPSAAQSGLGSRAAGTAM